MSQLDRTPPGASEGHATQAQAINDDERRLLRLFRCLRFEEQEALLQDVGARLVLRHLVEPEDREEWEDEDDVLRETLKRLYPGFWPGQQIVELDNLGDPGAVLESVLDELAESNLLGSSEYDEGAAEMLADTYMERILEDGYPLPSDFDNEPSEDGREEDYKAIKAEFVHFMREWREQVCLAIEKECKKVVMPLQMNESSSGGE